MDQEMFQVGGSLDGLKDKFRYGLGRDFGKPMNAKSKTDNEAFHTTQDNLNISKIKLNHMKKMFLRIAIVLMVIFILANLAASITSIVESAHAIRLMVKGKYDYSKHAAKENLQWLGASTDIVRGDYENNVDSLAEKAIKNQMLMTDMSTPAPPKATFISRERLTTPEEELKKQFETK